MNENLNQNNSEKFQSLEDFSFEEVEPNTEGAICIYALPEDSLDIVHEKVKKELAYKFWWLQDEWKNEGTPKEQFSIESDKNKYSVFNFNESLSKKQLDDLGKGISFINDLKESPLINDYTILIKKTEAINPQSKQPYYGRHNNSSRIIVLYPRALELRPYREIPEVEGLEATIVHEFSHPIYSKTDKENREKWLGFGWQEITQEEKEENNMRCEKPTNPEKCVTTYAQFAQDEDFCESVVGLYAKSDKLDLEKSKFLSNFFDQSQTPSKLKITKKEKVEIPRVDTKIKFFRKKPSFVITKKN